ncbi:MAG: argininosuccinate lyase [Candidatus Hodarchaeota archaeon]
MKNIIRSRLDVDLDKVAKEFISSLQDDRNIVEEDILGTMAHDYMLYKQGIISEQEIKLILGSLLKQYTQAQEGKFKLDDAYEDIHPLVEANVINDIGIETGGKIHSGRSRNDQVALDIRLKLRMLLLELRTRAVDLWSVMIEKAVEYKDSPFPLYTHVQQAQIGTFGHLLTGWAFELGRHLDRLAQCYNRTNKSPLGACAVGGTSFPINRSLVADLLGFSGLIMNSMDAISSRDVLMENNYCIASLFVLYGRIAEDLIIYSSNEFNYVHIPDKFCSVSSVLPQKKNPDTLEIIRGKSAMAIAALNNQMIIAKGAPSGYNLDFQDCKPILWNIFASVSMATSLLSGIIKDMTLNEVKIKNNLESSFLTALDIAEHLSITHELPFRKSHEFIARFTQMLIKRGKSLVGFTPTNDELRELKDLGNEILGDGSIIDEDFIALLKNIDFFKHRKSLGSPSPDSLNLMVDALKKDLEVYNVDLSNDKDYISRKISDFLSEIKALIEKE